MSICDKCGAEVLNGFKFCPHCGHVLPKTETYDNSQEKINIICPKCERQIPFTFSSSAKVELTCPNCKKRFISRFVQIRAKRSSLNKKDGIRSYKIRIINPDGSEELIEITNKAQEDFELRSKDMAIFSYLNGEIRIVQNLSINRYMKIGKSECYLATYAYGAQSEEVRLLRIWRDSYLLKSRALTYVVHAYYLVSPMLIRYFGDNRSFRNITIILITPIVKIVKRQTEQS